MTLPPRHEEFWTEKSVAYLLLLLHRDTETTNRVDLFRSQVTRRKRVPALPNWQCRGNARGMWSAEIGKVVASQ
jgi:hypothetical protein